MKLDSKQQQMNLLVFLQRAYRSPDEVPVFEALVDQLRAAEVPEPPRPEPEPEDD